MNLASPLSAHQVGRAPRPSMTVSGNDAGGVNGLTSDKISLGLKARKANKLPIPVGQRPLPPAIFNPRRLAGLLKIKTHNRL